MKSRIIEIRISLEELNGRLVHLCELRGVSAEITHSENQSRKKEENWKSLRKLPEATNTHLASEASLRKREEMEAGRKNV